MRRGIKNCALAILFRCVAHSVNSFHDLSSIRDLPTLSGTSGNARALEGV
jgi:hypothetical protein